MFVGYVVAWLDERTPLISAAALVAVLLWITLAASAIGHNAGPIWGRFAASIIGVCSPMAGAIIRVRYRQRAPNPEPRTVNSKPSL